MKTLKTYECKIEGFFRDGTDLVSKHIAATPSKARYMFWFHHNEYLTTYRECFKHIRVLSRGVMKPEHFFHDRFDFERCCKIRNIEFARKGMIVDVDGDKGWIVGSNASMNLDVLFEGSTSISNCHPTWEITYYGAKMNVIKCFKEHNNKEATK